MTQPHNYPIQLPVATRFVTDHWSSGQSVQLTLNYKRVCDDIKSGATNPKFRELIRRGGNATLPYTRQTVKKYVPFTIRGTSSWRSGSYYIRGSGFATGFWPGATLVTDEDAAVRDAALSKLKQKLSSQAGRHNVAVPLAEMLEFRGLVLDLLKTVPDFLTGYLRLRQAVKHRNVRSWKRSIRKLQKYWLTWSFAINPLISDISETGKAIAAHMGRSGNRNVVLTGTAGTSFRSGPIVTTMGALPQAGVLNIVSSVQRNLSYRYTAGFNIDLLNNEDWGSLPDKLGFNLASVPLIAWELTPYSWLFDYFSNVSQFLDDMSFVVPSGITNYVSLMKKEVFECRNEVYFSIGSNNSVSTTEVRPGELEVIFFQRTSMSQLPRVSLHFDFHEQIASNGVNRLLNLLSLLKLK